MHEPSFPFSLVSEEGGCGGSLPPPPPWLRRRSQPTPRITLFRSTPGKARAGNAQPGGALSAGNGGRQRRGWWQRAKPRRPCIPRSVGAGASWSHTRGGRGEASRSRRLLGAEKAQRPVDSRSAGRSGRY
eukprot:scaffold743_cov106-Isochrysis_galbana.AAC.2